MQVYQKRWPLQTKISGVKTRNLTYSLYLMLIAHLEEVFIAHQESYIIKTSLNPGKSISRKLISSENRSEGKAYLEGKNVI